MRIIYTRCLNCSNVFNQELVKCPKCGIEKSINEDINKEEPVFNLND